eukprot:TRINITY_DN2771_c0_g1_i1.p1 TRINITY_DN2771_c0_g1~~TRINITY_DN2771_c0_g1_i1.p1  ORF type:complete len:107 (+),score=23.72 TRINITY_DN2771_c0_g1_i1:128-448(+)
MFENVVRDILIKKLGKYFKGISKEEINVGMIRGDIELNNLELNEEALSAIPFPIEIRSGCVGHLKISIPWLNLGNAPIIIELSKVVCIVNPRLNQAVNNYISLFLC